MMKQTFFVVLLGVLLNMPLGCLAGENNRSFVYNFESNLSGWTTIDANNDGYTWFDNNTIANYTSSYNSLMPLNWCHGGTNGACSASFINGVGALSPDDYLVSPQVTVGTDATFSFWVAAVDPSYPADHFGVAVSTASNTNPADFTILQEWTLTAKSAGTYRTKDNANAKASSREGKGIALATWYNYSVDLSAYAGQQVYIAFRHFNCSDQYIMVIDDAELGGSGDNPNPPDCQWYYYDNGTYESSIGLSSSANFEWGVMFPAGCYAGNQVTKVQVFDAAAMTGEVTIYSGGTSEPNNAVGSMAVTLTGVQNFIEFEFPNPITVDATQNLWVVFNNQSGAHYPAAASVDVTSDPNGRWIRIPGSGWMDCATTGTPGYSFMIHTHITGGASDYSITVSPSPTNGGVTTVIGSGNSTGSFIDGQWCTVKATSATGYEFTNWKENNSVVPNAGATYTFQVHNDRNLKAYFSPCQYTVTLNPNGGTINSGNVTSYTYGVGATLPTNVTKTGYTFGGWYANQNLSGSPVTSITSTATGDKTYWAKWVPRTYNVTLNRNGGTINSGNVTSYTYGVGATLPTNVTKTGYTFGGWYAYQNLSGSPVTSISSTATGDKTYWAKWNSNTLTYYTIKTSANPSHGGWVEGSGEYVSGETCTLKAHANDGYVFDKWEKDGITLSTNNPELNITVLKDAEYVAYFTESSSELTVTIISNPSAGGTVSGDGTYTLGAICTLTAIPNEGYVFANWVENGEVVSPNDQYSFVVDRNRVLYANFNTSSSYFISASAGANGSITPQGDIEVSAGGSQTFSIVPNFGCRISSVFVDGVDLGAIETYTFPNVNTNHTIIALFSGWGVEEDSSTQVDVFPNPAKDYVVVEGSDVAEIQFYNMLGEKVLDVNGYSDVITVSTGNLPSGTYVVVITLQNGERCFGKVVIAD